MRTFCDILDGVASNPGAVLSQMPSIYVLFALEAQMAVVRPSAGVLGGVGALGLSKCHKASHNVSSLSRCQRLVGALRSIAKGCACLREDHWVC